MGSTTSELLDDLVEAFHYTDKMSAQAFKVYVRELESLPDNVLEQAFRDLMRTSRFFPSIEAVLEAAAERWLALPEPPEALSQAERRMEWARTRGSSQGHSGPPEVHPLVRSAIEVVGGYPALRSEKASFIRAQLVKVYREMRETAIRDAKKNGLSGAR